MRGQLKPGGSELVHAATLDLAQRKSLEAGVTLVVVRLMENHFAGTRNGFLLRSRSIKWLK